MGLRVGVGPINSVVCAASVVVAASVLLAASVVSAAGLVGATVELVTSTCVLLVDVVVLSMLSTNSPVISFAASVDVTLVVTYVKLFWVPGGTKPQMHELHPSP